MTEKELRDQVLLAIYENQDKLNVDSKIFCESVGIDIQDETRRNRVFKTLRDERYIQGQFSEDGSCYYLQGITSKGVDYIESNRDSVKKITPLKDYVKKALEDNVEEVNEDGSTKDDDIKHDESNYTENPLEDNNNETEDSLASAPDADSNEPIDLEYELDPSMYAKAKEEKITIKTKSVSPCFQVNYISEIFAQHLDSMTCEDSQMVGIFGKWGRGKTYFWDKVKSNLDTNKYTFVEFNAWKYQETPALWAYLYIKFQDVILSNWWKKLWFNIGLNWGAFIRDTFILIAIILTLISNVFYTDNNVFKWTIALFSVAYWAIRVYQKNLSSVVDSLRKTTRGKDWSLQLGTQAEIENDLIKLLKKSIKTKDVNKNKIVLFIDDIDRCDDEKMIKIIDSLRTVLENEDISKRLVIVCAVDGDRLCVALREKYSSAKRPDVLAKEQMDKIFLSGIKLRKIYYEEQIEFVKTLIENNRQEGSENQASTEQETTEQPLNDQASTEQETTEQPLNDQASAEQETTEQPLNDQASAEQETTEQIEEEQNLKNELSDTEVLSVFRKILTDTDASEITPRQLRIIYYRYKLANNILKESKIPHDAIAKSIYYKTRGRNEIIKMAPSYNDVVDTVVCY